MEQATIVIAKYKVIKDCKSYRYFDIRFKRIWNNFLNFFKNYFTNIYEIEKEVKFYTSIYTITEKGIEKLDKMPKSIIMCIEQKIEQKEDVS